MSVKSVLSVVTGFLAHHKSDLDSAVTALSGILDALPVNSETRAHIQVAINGIASSADNIATALENGINAAEAGTSQETLEIRASDIKAAVDDYLSTHSEAFGVAVAAYLDAHPVPIAADGTAIPAHDPAPGSAE